MEYNDYILNGEIYLKRGPEPYKKRRLQEIDDEIYDLNFNLSSYNPDFGNVEKIEQLKKLKQLLLKKTFELDYRGCSSFWQLFTNDGVNLTMVRCDFVNQERTYNNKIQMEQDFIKLIDFLENSVFIGKQFLRTQSIVTSSGLINRNYCIEDDYFLNVVLYATKDLFLVKKINNEEEFYCLIDSKYILDGKYKFFGKVYDEYRDKSKVYFEVLKQTMKQNIKYKKRKL